MGYLWPRVVAGLLAAATISPSAWAGPAQGLPASGGRPAGATRDLIDLGPIAPVVGHLLRQGRDWYLRTPAAARVCWGGLMVCAGLGLAVLGERMLLLRRRRIIPTDFTARFLDRLHEGKLDAGKALDYCEMNPSPASRVALAAVRRWGRPSIDLDRAVALACRVEAERLGRNVGTLRRIAAVAPLLGLLGTLTAAGRILASVPGTSVGVVAWGPAASEALSYLTAGIAIATLALVAYDALSVRIERLCGALDRLGVETIDAIAMAAPVATSLLGDGPSLRAHDAHPGLGVAPRPALGSLAPDPSRRFVEDSVATGTRSGHHYRA